MKNSILTLEEMNAALDGGDNVCTCGYRKSQHGVVPAACPKFNQSNGLTYGRVDEEWLRGQRKLRRGKR